MLQMKKSTVKMSIPQLLLIFILLQLGECEGRRREKKVFVGSNVTLCCRPKRNVISALNRKSMVLTRVQWHKVTNKKDSALKSDQRIKVSSPGSCKGQYASSIQFSHTVRSDEGMYYCRYILKRRKRTRVVAGRDRILLKVPDKNDVDGWRAIPSISKENTAVKDISSGLFSLWVVDTANNSYILNTQSSTWKKVMNSDLKITRLAAGESGVWVLDEEGKAFVRSHVTDVTPTGKYWIKANQLNTNIEKGNPKFKEITSGPPGVVIALDFHGNVYCRSGVSDSNIAGDLWFKSKSKVNLTQISCGSYGCIGMDSSGFQYRADRKLIYCSLEEFVFMDESKKSMIGNDTMKLVSAGTGPIILAVDTKGQIYRRYGVGFRSARQSSLSGLRWRGFGDKKMRSVTVGYSGIFGLDLKGLLFSSTAPSMVKIVTTNQGTIQPPEKSDMKGAGFDYSDVPILCFFRIPTAKKLVINYEGTRQAHCMARYRAVSFLRLKNWRVTSSCGSWERPARRDSINGGYYIIEYTSSSLVKPWKATYKVLSSFDAPKDSSGVPSHRWLELNNTFVATSVANNKDGTYATDDSDSLYRLGEDGWEKVGRGIKRIAGDEAGVWALTSDGRIKYKKKGNGPIVWSYIAGPPGVQVTTVEPGLYRHLFALDSNNGFWCLSSTYNETFKVYDNKWHLSDKKFRKISAGVYGIWSIDLVGSTWFSYYRSYQWGIGLDNCHTSYWREVEHQDSFVQMAVETGPNIWALDSQGKLYRSLRVGSTSDIPWQRVFYQSKDRLKSIVGGSFRLLGITQSGKIIENTGFSCGGYIEGKNQGTLSSINFPLPFPSNHRCLWILHFPGAEQIQFNLMFSDLEYGYHCDDRVSLVRRSSWTGQSRQSRDICGSGSNVFASHYTDMVFVEFTSSFKDIASYRGFKLEYRIIGIRKENTEKTLAMIEVA